VANSRQLFPISVCSIQKGNAERSTKHSTNRIGLLFPGSRGVTLLSNTLDAAVILIQESMFGDQGCIKLSPTANVMGLAFARHVPYPASTFSLSQQSFPEASS
jgi:hypothetical protein